MGNERPVFRQLTDEEWQKILALNWPKASLVETLQRVRASGGNGLATEILQGGLHQRQRINKTLANAALPYRLMRYNLPKEQIPDRPSGRIDTLGLRLCTLEPPL